MPAPETFPSGAPCWVDLMTSDTARSREFYCELFGWHTHVLSDTPEFHYTTLKHGEEWLAGIMDASGMLPAEVPAHWSVYFGVANADAALAKIVDLGGAVLEAAHDTPYGRLAVAADPTGARFKLVAPNEVMPTRNSMS